MSLIISFLPPYNKHEVRKPIRFFSYFMSFSFCSFVYSFDVDCMCHVLNPTLFGLFINLLYINKYQTEVYFVPLLSFLCMTILYLLFYVLWPPSKPKQATAKKIMCKRPCTNCKLNINHMIVSNDVFGWFVCDGQALPLLTRLRRNKKKQREKWKQKSGDWFVWLLLCLFSIYMYHTWVSFRTVWCLKDRPRALNFSAVMNLL